ncbi:hypothetical protein ACRALDRAFT_2021995 [Sodiomyces alcalophilus JCM 7366]|uniref:uncharacterized protein n=1 Tax=Sodiomyces alcalophilus JCM 7366 TaxID=591952 RepID=UPI0039B6D6C8
MKKQGDTKLERMQSLRVGQIRRIARPEAQRIGRAPSLMSARIVEKETLYKALPLFFPWEIVPQYPSRPSKGEKRKRGGRGAPLGCQDALCMQVPRAAGVKGGVYLRGIVLHGLLEHKAIYSYSMGALQQVSSDRCLTLETCIVVFAREKVVRRKPWVVPLDYKCTPYAFSSNPNFGPSSFGPFLAAELLTTEHNYLQSFTVFRLVGTQAMHLKRKQGVFPYTTRRKKQRQNRKHDLSFYSNFKFHFIRRGSSGSIFMGLPATCKHRLNQNETCLGLTMDICPTTLLMQRFSYDELFVYVPSFVKLSRKLVPLVRSLSPTVIPVDSG